MTLLHPQARPILPDLHESVFPDHLVSGTLFMEVVLHREYALSVPGWTLRLWPQARLGDATLEARTSGAQTADDLIAGLRAQGIQVLGPVRHRKS
jgi:hypothetical protein